MEKIGRERRSESAWREIVSRQAESGLSVQVFCEREGIKAASLYGWRSRLAGVSRKELVGERTEEAAAKEAPGRVHRPGRTGLEPIAVRGAAGSGWRCVTAPRPWLMFFAEGQIRVHLYGHPCISVKSAVYGLCDEGV
jgi:hypothetical protein